MEAVKKRWGGGAYGDWQGPYPPPTATFAAGAGTSRILLSLTQGSWSQISWVSQQLSCGHRHILDVAAWGGDGMLVLVGFMEDRVRQLLGASTSIDNPHRVNHTTTGHPICSSCPTFLGQMPDFASILCSLPPQLCWCHHGCRLPGSVVVINSVSTAEKSCFWS